MSIDRVATSAQTAYFLSQIQNAGSTLDKTQEKIASGKNATTYAGFGNQTQVLTATIAANARNSAYTTATKLAVTQTDLQDTQLTSLADLAAKLKKAVSDAVANNDASTLMAQVRSIFDQASGILNSKDANGDYIYAGGKTGTAPITVTSLADLQALPSVAGAFANGDLKKSVQVADAGAEGHRRLRCGRQRQFRRRHQPVGGAERLSQRRHRHPDRHRHRSARRVGRQRLCLQPVDRRAGKPDLDEHPLQGVCLRHPGHQHGRGGDPAVAEPDPASGVAGGDLDPAPAFAAELHAPVRRRKGGKPGFSGTFLRFPGLCAYIAGMSARSRIVVATSGGVDSSVTAALLKKQGHEVIGVTLQLYASSAQPQRKGACCAGSDIYDARRVAETLGIMCSITKVVSARR